MTKFELRVKHAGRAVERCTERLGVALVVRHESVWRARIRERKATARIHVAEQDLRERLRSLHARPIAEDDPVRGVGDRRDDAGTALEQYENDGGAHALNG